MKLEKKSILPILMVIAAAVVIIGGIKIASDIIAPFIIIVFLSVLCMPYYEWLKKKNLKTWQIATILFFSLSLVLFGLIALVAVSALSLMGKIGTYQSRVISSADSLQTQLAALGISESTIQDATSQVFNVITALSVAFISGLTAMVLGVFLTIMGIIFIVLESDQFAKRLTITFGEKSPELQDLSSFRTSLLHYFLARVNVNLFTAIGVMLPLFLMQIDFVLLWGVVTFIFSFVPYIGFMVALIPPTLLAFAQYGIWGAVAVIAIFTIVNQIAENIIAPKAIGDRVNISPAVVFFSVFFFMWLLGGLGALIAAPLTVLLIMILKKFPETEWLGNLFTKTTKPSP